MKRVVIIVIGIVIATASLYAVPAKKNVSRTVVLSDGSEVVVVLKGDEYSRWWETEDGIAVTIDEDGVATVISDSELEERQANGAKRKAARNEARGRRLAKAKDAGKSNAGYTGEKKGLVILVNFANATFSSDTPQEDFDRQFNEEGYSENNHIGSVSDYFRDQSYGAFNLSFDVVGPVTVSQNYSYYGQNDNSGNDRYPCTLVIEACDSIDSVVDFSDYDWDGDGEVDQVFLVYAGYGENAGAASSTIWPHEWNLADGSTYYKDGSGAQTYDGVTVDTYAMTCELAGYSGTTVAGIGTACHEFSHCLGFPDFYDTSYSGGWGMDAWDLLDSGSYNGPGYNGEVPAGYTSYERWVAGWLEPTVITEDTEVTAMQPLNDVAEAYILYNDGNTNEYYMLEHRQASDWFGYLNSYTAPSGMLILHVDYNETAWKNNLPNDDADHQRMTIFQANNELGTYRSYYYSLTNEQYQGHLYPYEENDSLTCNSTPAATLYNKNASGAAYMPIGIYGITLNDDATMAFYCAPSTAPVEDSSTTGDYIFYESFDSCTGTGGNDGRWNGNIARGVLYTDNEGWSANYFYGANQCAKFGTSEFAGEVVSPSFTLNGDAVLTFKASAWNSSTEGNELYLSVSNTQTTAIYTLAKGEWTEIETDISGSGEVSLYFLGDKRFFLDEVKVVAAGATGIKSVKAVSGESAKIYSVTGQYVGTSLSALPAGVYVMNGKKVVRK